MTTATFGQAAQCRMRRATALGILLAGIAIAGCGSSSSGSSSSSSTPASPAATPTTSSNSAPAGAAGEGQSLSLEANSEGQLKYNTTALTAKAGNVSIAFTNMASLSHNVTVESSSGSVIGATPTFQGGSKTLTLSLKPGAYKFYCSVPGHRTAGMEGTLTVK
ncbi:MAG TPA: plastocyanin/azurin family copper-binding protein [Solirubrobacteraceae bacterium]|nr:plastocyanin/azurin family copper-binding protein [Solirubrobacteraceae bacterium]